MLYLTLIEFFGWILAALLLAPIALVLLAGGAAILGVIGMALWGLVIGIRK